MFSAAETLESGTSFNALASWLKRCAAILGAAALLAVSGCASAGKFVWYSDLPRGDWGPSTSEYVIGVGDVISIRVYEQDNVSTSARIRSDGRIALTFLGEMVAAGKHPSELATEIETRLKAFIVTPRVTVNVEQSQPVVVTLAGEVSHSGTLSLEPPAKMLQALAQAGFTEFADKSKIFLLRQFPTFQRIRFTYAAVFNNEGDAATFPLRTGDVIVVE